MSQPPVPPVVFQTAAIARLVVPVGERTNAPAPPAMLDGSIAIVQGVFGFGLPSLSHVVSGLKLSVKANQAFCC